MKKNKLTKPTFEQRKADHIKLSLDVRTQAQTSSDFDLIRLNHQAFPEINLSDISLQTELLNHRFLSPHFISSMTAGHKKGETLNLRLAQAAANAGWLMAIGSQRRELTDSSSAQEWKKIKKKSSQTKFVGNIGLEELIAYPVEHILKLIDATEAIGLFVHTNPLQEAFQKYNEATFRGGYKALENLVKKSPVPILVKECGYGLAPETVKKLFSLGVQVVDVSGKGGTHWGLLEGLRDNSSDKIRSQASLAFKDWGFSAVESLLAIRHHQIKKSKQQSVWASGGVRSGVDSVKCLVLGAQAVGLAQPLMRAAVVSEKAVLNVMNRFDYELKISLFGLGVLNLKELASVSSAKNQRVWMYK